MSFWAARLNGTPPPPVVPASRELYPQYLSVPQEALSTIPQQPQSVDYKPTVRMTTGGICPGCGTDNYLPHPPGQPSVAVACNNCGYHPRFAQEGNGVRVPSAPGAKVVAARQVDAAGTNIRGQIAQMNANQHANIPNISQ